VEKIAQWEVSLLGWSKQEGKMGVMGRREMHIGFGKEMWKKEIT
jgi:hypothetical protein